MILLNQSSYPTKLKSSENKTIIPPFTFTQKPSTDSEATKPIIFMKKVRMNRSSSAESASKLVLSQILKPTANHKQETGEVKLFEVVDLKSSLRDQKNTVLFNINEYLEEKINSSHIKEKPPQTSSSNLRKTITLNLNTRNKLRETINSKTLRERCEPYFFGDFRQNSSLKLSQRPNPEPNELVLARAIIAQKAVKIFQNPEISRRIMQDCSKETIEHSIEDIEIASESSHLTEYIPTERELLYRNSPEPVKSKPTKNSEIFQERKSFMGLYVVGRKVDKNNTAIKIFETQKRRAKTESSFLFKDKNTESSREEEKKTIVEQLFRPMVKSQVIPSISKPTQRSSQHSLQRTIYPFMAQKETFPGVKVTKTFYVSDLMGHNKHKRSQSTRVL